MVIVKESLIGRDQLRLQDLFKEAQNVQEVITLFLATLELIKTQELILVQEESFGDIYLMEKKEESQDSSLSLIETGGAYRLVTKPQFAAILKEYSKAPINQSLSRAALETLSIIAYKQPITRIEIDAIRGVNSSGALAKLQAFELIREDGKKEVLGRPNLYVTTDYFLDYMGINHLEELPVIDELEIQAQESQLFGERIEEDENQ